MLKVGKLLQEDCKHVGGNKDDLDTLLTLTMLKDVCINHSDQGFFSI